MQALCGNHKYIRPGGGARTHGLLPQTERHSHWSSKANNSRSSKPTPLSIRPHSHTIWTYLDFGLACLEPFLRSHFPIALLARTVVMRNCDPRKRLRCYLSITNMTFEKLF